jgi:hypothetical protein
MAEQVRSDEENRLREILKRQTEDMDRSYMRAGVVVVNDLDLLSEIWRFLHSDGPFLPETKASLVSRLGFLNHELCRSRDYINLRNREADDTRFKLRVEREHQKAQAATP